MDYQVWFNQNKGWLAEKLAKCDNPSEIERVLERIFAIWSNELSKQIALVVAVDTLIARVDNLKSLPAPASPTDDELNQ